MIITETAAAAGSSFQGKNHDKNDDRLLVTSLNDRNILLAVSDGLGGHSDGDWAAGNVISCLSSIDINTADKSTLLADAIDQADTRIRERVKKCPPLEGMGATATAAIIGPETMHWAHIGDSRLYLMRNGVLRQITKDHTFLQDLIDAGDITAKAALSHPMRHVLDQCVGCVDNGADSGKLTIHTGDIILATTDGLHRTVTDDIIAKIISSSDNVSHCMDSLIEASLGAGNLDDVSVAVAFIKK